MLAKEHSLDESEIGVLFAGYALVSTSDFTEVFRLAICWIRFCSLLALQRSISVSKAPSHPDSMVPAELASLENRCWRTAPSSLKQANSSDWSR